uniref:intraflagellar transport protein 46 homolog isoform X1 n=2 Tax=Myxine glutinosa TaxID=7769 RepID=UPI00358FEE29
MSTAKGRDFKPKLLSNQHFDESVEVSDSEEVSSVESCPSHTVLREADMTASKMDGNLTKWLDKKDGSTTGGDEDEEKEEDEEEDSEEEDDDDDDDDDDSRETDSDDDESILGPEGSYNPSDYAHLAVTPDLKEIFQHITRYTPHNIPLKFKLKPFIPNFTPSIGDIDPFIKVSRPDGKPETLGLTVLDEPSGQQSEPTVLNLWLEEESSQPLAMAMKVKTVQVDEHLPKTIENWVHSITELRHSKAAPHVEYSRPMPSIESLMQEWPPEFEDTLNKVNVPTAGLQCDLFEYVDIICAILDIPVYKSRVQSLHVLFTLYSEFKNSPYFSTLVERKSPLDLAVSSSWPNQIEAPAVDSVELQG